MKITLRAVGGFGFLIFATAFGATFVSPIHFEQAGKEFIRGQVEAQVRDKIDGLRPPSLEKVAGVLAKQYQGEIVDLQRKLKENLPEKVAAVVAQMQDLSCECRKKLASSIRQSIEWRTLSLGQAQSQLVALIEGKYVEVVEKLLRDLRIFTGSSGAVFLFLLIVSFLRERAVAHLFLPGMLLLVATLISAYFYLFQQNWFFTIIYNDYVGFGYIAYLSLVFLFLCDVVFNRARITTEIINRVLNAIGSTMSIAPC